MSRRNIEVNRWGECLHLRWRSGLHFSQPKMLEDLFDHFPIFDEGDDSHLTLAFGTGQGINLILTRFADDWVVTCKTRVEAKSAIATARKILAELGVILHADVVPSLLSNGLFTNLLFTSPRDRIYCFNPRSRRALPS